MSVRAVDVAIHRLRALLDEMEGVDSESWLPTHTLHLFVDPMLRALGWDPSDSAVTIGMGAVSPQGLLALISLGFSPR